MMNLSVLTLLSTLLTTLPVFAQPIPKHPPNLVEEAKQSYQKQYLPAANNKAFGFTRDGKKFAAIAGVGSADEAARALTARCLSKFDAPCMLWLVNSQEVYTSIASAARQSAAVVAELPAGLDGKRFADEAKDHGVDAPAGMRAGSEMHGPTPMAAPRGGRVIYTDELLKLYKAEKRVVVLDVIHSKSIKRQALPKARWLYGAGWEQAEVNAEINRLLAPAMRSIAPRKDSPIVAYCSNRDCWLSWNTARRLIELGYKNVYWYRGGIEAWRAAGLPLVETPLFAHLW